MRPVPLWFLLIFLASACAPAPSVTDPPIAVEPPEISFPEPPAPPPEPSWAWTRELAEPARLLGGTVEGDLVYWELESRSEIWRRPGEGFLSGPPAVAGEFFWLRTPGRLEARSLSAGELLWARDWAVLESFTPAVLESFPSGPVFSEGFVELYSSQGRRVLDASNGRDLSLWPFSAAETNLSAFLGLAGFAPVHRKAAREAVSDAGSQLLASVPESYRAFLAANVSDARAELAVVNDSGEALWSVAIRDRPVWVAFNAMQSRKVLWSSPTAEEFPVKLSWIDEKGAELASNLGYGSYEAILETIVKKKETALIRIEAADPSVVGQLILLSVR